MKRTLVFKDLKKIIRLANDLDKKGLQKEADLVDSFIEHSFLKIAEEQTLEFKASGRTYKIPANTTGNYTEGGLEKRMSPAEMVDLIKTNMNSFSGDSAKTQLARQILLKLKPTEATGGAGFYQTDSWSISTDNMGAYAPSVKDYILRKQTTSLGYSNEFEFFVSNGKLFSQGLSLSQFITTISGAGIVGVPATTYILQQIGFLSQEQVENLKARWINSGTEIPITLPTVNPDVWQAEIKYILDQAGNATGAAALKAYYGLDGTETPTTETTTEPTETQTTGQTTAPAQTTPQRRRARTCGVLDDNGRIQTSGRLVVSIQNQINSLIDSRTDPWKNIPRIAQDEISDQQFGNTTKAAVKKFQSLSNLTVDCQVGNNTKNALIAALRSIGGGGTATTQTREAPPQRRGYSYDVIGKRRIDGKEIAIIDTAPDSTRWFDARFKWGVNKDGRWAYSRSDRLRLERNRDLTRKWTKDQADYLTDTENTIKQNIKSGNTPSGRRRSR